MRFTSRTLLTIVTTLLLAAGCTSPTPEPPEPTSTATPVAPTEVPPTETPMPTATSTPTPTPTPTVAPVSVATPTEPVASACTDLSGELEVQILVGPAEAVGLEPVAVGSVPFTVSEDEGNYVVQGQEALSYEAALEREWGSYSVSLEMAVVVDGLCMEEEEGEAVLDLTVVSRGEQMVEVNVGGSQQQYPWEGETTLQVSMPAADGATAEGEGWAFVLRLE